MTMNVCFLRGYLGSCVRFDLGCDGRKGKI